MVNRYLGNEKLKYLGLTLHLHFLLVVELECLRELIHELPGGVDELGENWRDLLAVAGKETTPAHNGTLLLIFFILHLHFHVWNVNVCIFLQSPTCL